MIDALIGGTLFGAAVERTGQSGKTFVTAKVRAADSDGEGQFVNVVAFDGSVKTALLALDDGDSVSLSGAMKVGTFEARDGTTRISISMVAPFRKINVKDRPWRAVKHCDAVFARGT